MDDFQLHQVKAELFKALAHPIRIRILELLREGNKYVHELQEELEVGSAVVSQQLSILRSKNIVEGHKEGNRVTYSVKDETIFQLLDVAKKLLQNHLSDTISLLHKMNTN